MAKSSSLDVLKDIFWSTLFRNKLVRAILVPVVFAVIISCYCEAIARGHLRDLVKCVKQGGDGRFWDLFVSYVVHYLLHCAFGWLHNHMFCTNINVLKSIIYGHLIKMYMEMDYTHYHSIGSRKVCSYINKQTDSSVFLLKKLCLKLFYGLFYLVIFFKMLLYDESIMVEIKMFFVAVLFAIMMLTAYCIVVGSKKKSKLLSSEHSASHVLLDIFANFNVVKAFNKESSEIFRYGKAMQEPIEAGRAYHLFQEGSRVLFRMITFSFPVLFMLNVHYGFLSTFACIKTYAVLNDNFMDFKGKINTIKDCIMSMSDRLVETSTCELVLASPKNDLRIMEKRPVIEFSNVSIGLCGNTLFSGLSMLAAPGDKIAITGRNGSGKSTIIKALLGFHGYDGDIRIGGKQISEVAEDLLHNCISYVPQEPHLLSVSVMDNLRYGRDCTDEEIVEACVRCGTHEIFKSMRDGYSTVIDENSKNISGGQAQMVNFMRAVIKNAPIFLLDEPTSNLDYATSNQIVDKIFTILHGHTVFFSTHNPHHLRRFDRIVNISGGKVRIFNGYEEFKSDASSEFSL